MRQECTNVSFNCASNQYGQWPQVARFCTQNLRGWLLDAVSQRVCSLNTWEQFSVNLLFSMLCLHVVHVTCQLLSCLLGWAPFLFPFGSNLGAKRAPQKDNTLNFKPRFFFHQSGSWGGRVKIWQCDCWGLQFFYMWFFGDWIFDLWIMHMFYLWNVFAVVLLHVDWPLYGVYFLFADLLLVF